MTTEQFTYWLQGFIELMETDRPSQNQWDSIKEHIQLVLKKETLLFPSRVEQVEHMHFPSRDLQKYMDSFPDHTQPSITC